MIPTYTLDDTQPIIPILPAYTLDDTQPIIPIAPPTPLPADMPPGVYHHLHTNDFTALESLERGEQPAATSLYKLYRHRLVGRCTIGYHPIHRSTPIRRYYLAPLGALALAKHRQGDHE